MLASLLSFLFVFGAVAPGGDPYYLLRSRLEAADMVVIGKVQSIRDVKEVMRAHDRVAVLELSGRWKGGSRTKFPETLKIHQWKGPAADSRRRAPWVFFLARGGIKKAPVFSLQAAVDLSALRWSQREVFQERVQKFVEIERLDKEAARLRATVVWLMSQTRDPISREGATYDLERRAFYSRLTEREILTLQDLYCSLDGFDMTAGHLTDILEKVATDRERFVRCAFQLLQGEVERATWIEEGLVGVIEKSLTCDEIADLVSEYRATQPVHRMRHFEDSSERRTARRDVLRRLCEATQRELDQVAEASSGLDEPPSTNEAMMDATGR